MSVLALVAVIPLPSAPLPCYTPRMKKWFKEDFEWEIEVTGFLRGSETEGYCRNGEEIGDKYTCIYGYPVNAAGQGICSKVMAVMFPVMEAVRSGGDLRNIGGSGRYTREIVCPDGCVVFRMTARPVRTSHAV